MTSHGREACACHVHAAYDNELLGARSACFKRLARLGADGAFLKAAWHGFIWFIMLLLSVLASRHSNIQLITPACCHGKAFYRDHGLPSGSACHGWVLLSDSNRYWLPLGSLTGRPIA